MKFSVYLNTRVHVMGTTLLVSSFFFFFFFFFTGFHHFYLENGFMGGLYFVTGGLFGIGWLVDLARIPSLVKEANLREPVQKQVGHPGVQLRLAYSWARPVILVAGKGRKGMYLFLLFLLVHSCSSFFPVPPFYLLYYIFCPFF